MTEGQCVGTADPTVVVSRTYYCNENMHEQKEFMGDRCTWVYGLLDSLRVIYAAIDSSQVSSVLYACPIFNDSSLSQLLHLFLIRESCTLHAQGLSFEYEIPQFHAALRILEAERIVQPD